VLRIPNSNELWKEGKDCCDEDCLERSDIVQDDELVNDIKQCAMVKILPIDFHPSASNSFRLAEAVKSAQKYAGRPVRASFSPSRTAKKVDMHGCKKNRIAKGPSGRVHL
jgi:hypothetical protein